MKKRVVNPDLLRYCNTCKEKKQYGRIYEYQHCSRDTPHERFECVACEEKRKAREKKEAAELAEKRKTDPTYGLIFIPNMRRITSERFRKEWGCTRTAGHEGECMTVGVAGTIHIEDCCPKWGARWLEPNEPRPDDLYEYDKNKSGVKWKESTWYPKLPEEAPMFEKEQHGTCTRCGEFSIHIDLHDCKGPKEPPTAGRVLYSSKGLIDALYGPHKKKEDK